MSTFSWEATLPFLYLPLFPIGSTLKEKEFAPAGANSSLEEKTPLLEGLCY